MIPALISFPTLGIFLIIQTAILNRMPLLHGVPDIIMLTLIAWALQDRVKSYWLWTIIGALMVGFVSEFPLSLYLGIYLAITGTTLLIKRRVWQIPIIAMFILTLVGSIILLVATGFFAYLQGAQLSILDTLNLIILPSIILNLLFSIPIYAIIRDLAEWLHPEEIEP